MRAYIDFKFCWFWFWGVEGCYTLWEVCYRALLLMKPGMCERTGKAMYEFLGLAAVASIKFDSKKKMRLPVLVLLKLSSQAF